jgi:hypothetical protein
MEIPEREGLRQQVAAAAFYEWFHRQRSMRCRMGRHKWRGEVVRWERGRTISVGRCERCGRFELRGDWQPEDWLLPDER